MGQNIDKQIEILWKENPKIPFMQSKEILAYGYKKGLANVLNKICDDISDNVEKNINKQISEKNDGFTGTTKELIETTNKLLTKIKNEQNKQNKQDELIKELKEKSQLTIQEKNQIVKQTQIELLSEIMVYMKNPKSDYLSLFDFIDNKLRQLETNGTNDILRMR